MRPKLREQLHQLAMQPHGLLIVCGPTGAGKSTTLYACLQEIDRYPEERHHRREPGRIQHPQRDADRGQPQGRQDVRVGTAQHPPPRPRRDLHRRNPRSGDGGNRLSGGPNRAYGLHDLHANDTVTALARLIDLGVAPFTVSGSVTAILGQRLVRLFVPQVQAALPAQPGNTAQGQLAGRQDRILLPPAAGVNRRRRGGRGR